jgi:hypothetical protein
MTVRFSMVAIAGVAFSMLSSGCGPTCQSTCNKIYQPNECNVQRPGRTQDQLLDQCNDECEAALNNPGEKDGYDPFNDRGSSSDFTLSTDRQAAAWMECVDQTNCDLFSTGYCPPIW